MSPSVPKPPAPPPPPPTINQATQQADAESLLRRRRGYAATVLSQNPQAATRTGTASLLSNPGATRLGA